MLNVHAKNLGNVAVLSLQGQVVNGETEILRSAVQAVSGVSTLKLDLARVTTIDAGGLGAMLKLREQAESRGIRFELMNLSKQILHVFELTRLNCVFRITAGAQFFPTASLGRRPSALALRSCA
jgi:anti-anti-sigma factor